MLTTALTLVLGTALAGGPCDGPSTVAADAVAVLHASPAARPAKPSPQRGLPSGTLSLTDLERAFDQLAQNGATINDFFALLADGQRRTLPGDVVRKALEKYGVSLPFLPVANLESLTSDGATLTVNLDFGRSSSKKLKLPKSTNTVVASTSSSDPYATGSTRLQQVTGGGHTLVVQDTLTLGISDKGLTSIEGVAVKKLFSFSVNGHSLTSPGKVQTEDGDVVVQTDESGAPIVEDGHYVPATFDDWIILEVAGRKIEIGVPALAPQGGNS